MWVCLSHLLVCFRVMVDPFSAPVLSDSLKVRFGIPRAQPRRIIRTGRVPVLDSGFAKDNTSTEHPQGSIRGEGNAVCEEGLAHSPELLALGDELPPSPGVWHSKVVAALRNQNDSKCVASGSK